MEITKNKVIPSREVPREQFERLQELTDKFVEELKPEDKAFYEENIQAISPVKNNQLRNFKTTGKMVSIGKNQYVLEINTHKFPVLSDEAIIGLIAHEFAHAKDKNRTLLQPLHFILDWMFENNIRGKRQDIYDWNEDRTDKIVKEMGFEEEIETLREENESLDFRFEEHLEEDDIEPPISKKLELNCENCGRTYLGNYLYTDHNSDPRLDKDITCYLELHYQGVYRGVYRSAVPVEPSTILKEAECLNCEEKSVEHKTALEEV